MELAHCAALSSAWSRIHWPKVCYKGSSIPATWWKAWSKTAISSCRSVIVLNNYLLPRHRKLPSQLAVKAAAGKHNVKNRGRANHAPYSCLNYPYERNCRGSASRLPSIRYIHGKTTHKIHLPAMRRGTQQMDGEMPRLRHMELP